MTEQDKNRAADKAGARHERAARRSNRRPSPCVGAWEWNLQTGEAWYSPGVIAVLGLRPERCPPELNGFLAEVHPDDRERANTAITAAIAAGAGFEVLYRAIGADHRVR